MRSPLRVLVLSLAACPVAVVGPAALPIPGSALAAQVSLTSESMLASQRVDLAMIARIREEGLQRSQLPNTFSYMTHVLGARLTNSRDMDRAQEWVLAEMREIGLVNTALEPFMDYGVSWDNEYVSLHLMEPDYTPMVGYPIAHTPSTAGKAATYASAESTSGSTQ